MKESFISFLQKPNKKSFLLLRTNIINSESYDPYSEDLWNMNNLLKQQNFKEVIQYNNVNIMLSSRAHMYKSFAYRKFNDENGAEMESKIGQSILEAIETTGNGTLSKPYLITRIDDEKDFITYLDLIYVSQSMVSFKDKIHDCIITSKGKKIYFDISDCYSKLDDFSKSRLPAIENISEDEIQEEITTKKAWWKFW